MVSNGNALKPTRLFKPTEVTKREGEKINQELPPSSVSVPNNPPKELALEARLFSDEERRKGSISSRSGDVSSSPSLLISQQQ